MECKKDLGCLFIKSIFNNSEMYSVLVDKSGIVEYCSDKFKKFFGNIDIIGKKLSEFISPPAYEEIRKIILEVLFTSKQIENDVLFNDNAYYKIIAYPIFDSNDINKVSNIVLTAFNITQSKKLQIENEELKKKLEDSNSIKSIFLSNISHELRTPMNSIIGFSQLLLEEDNREQLNRFLKTINSNAKYLDELLSNILDYAKIESNEFDILYENFSLNDLLEELYNIFEDVNYRKNLDFVKLEFSKCKDRKIISDYLRLKQILFNLISNSIKFTEKGYIKLSYKECHDSIIFKIEDTGIGIPEDKLEFIYDRFWQNDSSSIKKYRGTGLGLSITKSLVEMLNGEIWVKSKLGEGTKFYVKIPLEEIKQELVIVKTKDKISFSGKTVLVVDEIPINYSMLTIYLNSLNINMLYTYTGEDAINIFKKQKDKIDLIIIDMNLPDMDGDELANRLKKEDEKCIILSKSGTSHNKNENINKHFKKPINKNKLISVLENIWQK